MGRIELGKAALCLLLARKTIEPAVFDVSCIDVYRHLGF
jgi:hypothetical protein